MAQNLFGLDKKGQKLAVQTPRMSVAFNMKPNTAEYPKYSVEFSFSGMESDESLRKFHDNIEAMDQFMIDAGVKNSMAWFKQKKVSRDVIEAKYSPMIKTPTDNETGEVLTQYPHDSVLRCPFMMESLVAKYLMERMVIRWKTHGRDSGSWNSCEGNY